MAARKFDVHPGVAMVQKWAAELPEKTGHTLNEWAELVNAAGLADRQERVAWLKDTHNLGTVTAWQIAEYATGSQTWDGDPAVYLRNATTYVTDLFAGGKAGLKPIFEKLMAEARKLGKDVKVCPCKTIIPFYRTRVFAEVKPATKTRLELALALGDAVFTARLRPNPRARGNDRLKQLFALTTVDDVDAEVLKTLKTAYTAAG